VTSSRAALLVLVFLILVAGIGWIFYNAFDSLTVAIAPTVLAAVALTAAVYFLTGGRRKSSL